jgi:hypothetical protein
MDRLGMPQSETRCRRNDSRKLPYQVVGEPGRVRGRRVELEPNIKRYVGEADGEAVMGSIEKGPRCERGQTSSKHPSPFKDARKRLVLCNPSYCSRESVFTP